MQVMTIDHAMWFHRDFRMDDWLLYAIDSPSASGARGGFAVNYLTVKALGCIDNTEGMIRDRS